MHHIWYCCAYFLCLLNIILIPPLLFQMISILYCLYVTSEVLCETVDKLIICILLVYLAFQRDLLKCLFSKVEGSERLEEGDYGSQISRFLEGYRAGRTMKKKVGRGTPTLLGVNAVYILIFLVAILLVLMYFSGQGEENLRPRAHED